MSIVRTSRNSMPRFLPLGRSGRLAAVQSLFLLCGLSSAPAAIPAPAPTNATPLAASEPAKPALGPLYIKEYRVTGSRKLSAAEIGETVYPFLGPGRSEVDVEQARAALEKVYKDKGFSVVAVQIPPQKATGGIVTLQVVEAPVGRLRVHGSRYFSLSQIKEKTPSLAEGVVPNFNDVTRDLIALNRLSDRRITPSLHYPGVEPGTVDIDLNVQDKFPMHGSVELNNRYSPNTTELRLNASLSYQNLWQLGHAVGFSFQIAPERTEDAKVYSAYYLARFPDIDWLSVILQGTKQDSNVSTLGGGAVAGRGEIVGGLVMITLPVPKNWQWPEIRTGEADQQKGELEFKDWKGFYHSLSLGLDYKHFNQGLNLGTGPVDTPVTYYPLSVSYAASLIGKNYQTELNAGVTFHLRGFGSDSAEFENNRFAADGNFLIFRGDLEHTIDLPKGFQISGKVQGQLTDQALLSSEQFSGGGLSTVRGYLESETPGDNAIFGSVELRSPSLLGWLGKKPDDQANEWRIYGFIEGGRVTIHSPLPEQQSRFELASYGIGSRIRLFDHVNGSIDAAVPMTSQQETQAGETRVTFRVWADF